ncbi:TetR/AcrR family transcriptional regulator [uncultured Adlercreutzia sp.]|uniref:TetR/AcrR family transcriptional regulator n=1 Tax=uncultured Adlercreutzia sp. TaxID=875803 RepID=UPI002665235F|nr:TetR/AcrR family transcriptional regulator [uncultured Adlercreutzia sp.]
MGDFPFDRGDAGVTPDGRTLIREAFLRLYECEPLSGITVEHLAREAGYSRAAFYRYYHSTGDVLADCEERALPVAQSRYIDEHIAVVTPQLFIELYLDYFAANERALRVLLNRDTEREFSQKLAGTIYPAFYAYLRKRSDIPEEDLDAMTLYLVESKLAQMRSWARGVHRPLAEYMRMPLETFERSFWQDVPTAAATD